MGWFRWTGLARPIAKAASPDAGEIARLETLLSKTDKRLARAFLEAVRRAADEIDVRHIADLIEAGRRDQAVVELNNALARAGFKPLGAEVAYSLTIAAQQATDAAAQTLASYHLVFDQTADDAVAYMRNSSQALMRDMTQAAQRNVLEIIQEGVQAGRNPLDTARNVRSMIGLTAYQSRAILNYRSGLENLKSDTLNRALRDRRFDASVARAIANQQPMDPKRIDKLVERYAARWLNYRANTISRTESLRALNGGSDTAWRQMLRGTNIPREAIRRRWHHSHDSKVRHSHLMIPTMNPDGVGLDEPFKSPEGPIMFPGDPAAPPSNTINCRCLLLVRVDTSMVPA